MPQKVSDADFEAACIKHVSATSIARALGLSERQVFKRRQELERREGIQLPRGENSHNPTGSNGWAPTGGAYAFRTEKTIRDGIAIVFGDMHCRPVHGRIGDTPAMSALLKVAARLSPDMLINMGDTLDGAAISRHPPLGWEVKPTVAEEIGGAQHDLSRIVKAAPKAQRHWIVGNHDERYDRHLAVRVPEFRNVTGMRLADNFPDWPLSWSLEINATLFVHRWHNGVHARWNNLLKAGGCHMVTADTHRSGTTHYTGQRGATWHAVEVGCMAEPSGPQFAYTRGLRPNWQMGFVILTWRDGEMCPPERCLVDDAGRAWFRGEVVAEKPRVRVRAGAAA
jgi:hypothetical protein